MEKHSDPNRTQAFLTLAHDQSLLSTEEASRLQDLAVQRGVAVSQVAIEEGVLDPGQVAMVETLLEPGDFIPGYEILSVLGQGGMGVVYKARQLNLDRIVAIKTILLGQAGLAGAVARFEKEAITVAKLRHPNIVVAHDFGKQAGRLYFVMEYLDGETVEELIDRAGKLDEVTTWGLVRQAAAGLAHAQDHGVIHRDIKPANLFLVQPPTGSTLADGLPLLKITDFGLVLDADLKASKARLTLAGTPLGTPLYMAPEQMGNTDIDARADIYALGATAFHMLAGEPPFLGATLWEILKEKTQPQARFLERLRSTSTTASIELVAAMMATEPAQRLGSYEELLARIDARPSRTAAVGKAAPRGAVRRSRVVWIGAACVGLLLTCLGIYLVQKNARLPTQNSLKLVQSDRTQMLYDGVGVSPPHWLISNGAWAPAADEEGGRVLSGRGLIRRRLPPLANYRLSLGVDLRQAAAVELHFGQRKGANDPTHLVLRLTRDGAFLARRKEERGNLEQLSPVAPRADTGSTYRGLRIDREDTAWVAFFDGERLGTAPAAPEQELPEFRLLTEGGTAFFDSIEVTELVKATP